LLELEGASRLRAEAQVPESLPSLSVGAAVAVRLDAAVVEGRLAELSPSADPATRTRLAKIDLPAGAGARSGQFVRVLWPAGERRGLFVPAAAVTRFGQMERAWAVEEGRARLRLVRTAEAGDGRLEILAGLSADERVVLAPPATLRDGRPVTVSP
jgi:hypothetical protein